MSNSTISKLTEVILCFFIFQQFSCACGFSFVGDGSAYVRFVNNSQTKDYFVSNASSGSTLNGANLGTNLTTLTLVFGEARMWESCTNEVKEAAILYRIYTNPAILPSFQTRLLRGCPLT